MTVSSASRLRTRAFARLIGPYLLIVPAIIALRAADMGGLAAAFFQSELAVWFTGAGLLFAGLVIIAFHQHWSSLAAVLISLFGWILALRGLTLLVVPHLYQQLAVSLEAVPVIQVLFGVIALIGLYLTYVGWIAEAPAN